MALSKQEFQSERPPASQVNFALCSYHILLMVNRWLWIEKNIKQDCTFSESMNVESMDLTDYMLNNSWDARARRGIQLSHDLQVKLYFVSLSQNWQLSKNQERSPLAVFTTSKQEALGHLLVGGSKPRPLLLLYYEELCRFLVNACDLFGKQWKPLTCCLLLGHLASCGGQLESSDSHLYRKEEPLARWQRRTAALTQGKFHCS